MEVEIRQSAYGIGAIIAFFPASFVMNCKIALFLWKNSQANKGKTGNFVVDKGIQDAEAKLCLITFTLFVTNFVGLVCQIWFFVTGVTKSDMGFTFMMMLSQIANFAEDLHLFSQPWLLIAMSSTIREELKRFIFAEGGHRSHRSHSKSSKSNSPALQKYTRELKTNSELGRQLCQAIKVSHGKLKISTKIMSSKQKLFGLFRKKVTPKDTDFIGKVAKKLCMKMQSLTDNQAQMFKKFKSSMKKQIKIIIKQMLKFQTCVKKIISGVAGLSSPSRHQHKSKLAFHTPVKDDSSPEDSGEKITSQVM
uniref:Serpentine receptor class gamma n=1 Tax=Ditylenchus dipsaci TaxID=166011 RepID=A0A915DWQ4_9BILA